MLEQQAQQPAQQPGAPQQLHHAALSAPGGVAAPWTVHRLLTLLADTQAPFGGAAVHLDTETSSSSLNVAPETWAAALVGRQMAPEAALQSPVAVPLPGLTLAEASAWPGSADALQGRVLKALRLGTATVAARLA